MMKDDMAIHAGIPEKAVKAAVSKLQDDEQLVDVTWTLPRARPGRPIKVAIEAERSADIQLAKQRLEQLLGEAGYDLYP
ncbi:hypothetical protein [Deinococcus sonorensis]|uniref:Uncharacterized protein n=2 Tax=Deinococcus sonorensis TaxID=309891 RepID=A0AAU7UC56_9DEIO